MSTIYLLLDALVDFGVTFFDFLILPVNDFLDSFSSSFSEFLLKLIEFAGLSNFFGTVSFGVFFLGTGLLTFLTVKILYFFIP